jgi:hypothetical protein
MMSHTPDSSAMTCCVRSAVNAASSEGRLSASSFELVWSDWVPPRTAASDDVVFGLLRRERAAGRLRVKAQQQRALVLRAETLLHDAGPEAPGGPEFCDLLEEVVVHAEEEGEARREIIHGEPRGDRGLDVRDRVREGEGDLLDGRRSRLANMVAADADGVPLRRIVLAPGENVRDDAHRGSGGIDVRSPSVVFLEDIILNRP